VFANGGFKVSPYFIDRIEDASGKVVWRAAPRMACPQCDDAEAPVNPPAQPLRVSDSGRAPAAAESTRGDLTHGEPAPLPESQAAPRVISPQNAYLMTDMMADVIKRGTGRRALALGRSDIAGKTGTTNEAKDTWFNGFTRNLVATVWVGFDQERSLGEAEEGARTALPIWMQFMREALQGVPEQRRTMPDGIVTLRISAMNGTLVSAENPDGIPELFMVDHLPSAQQAGNLAQGPEGQTSSEPIF
jgi:penicillin-binding protein 1A